MLDIPLAFPLINLHAQLFILIVVVVIIYSSLFIAFILTIYFLPFNLFPVQHFPQPITYALLRNGMYELSWGLGRILESKLAL